MRIIQGMFSGIRGTNFINTLLNVAYFRLARQNVLDMFDLAPVALTNIHMGDDVWISNESRLWAITLYTCMRATGYEFQDHKQMFDVCRGEFLRVVYTHEGARGYLARAMGSLLIRPLQGVDDISPQERATSLNSQIAILYRRGMSAKACRAIWYAVVPHALRLSLPGGSGVEIPTAVAMKRYTDGGFDIGPPGTMAHPGIVTGPPPVPVVIVEQLAEAIDRNMSRAWVAVMSEQYKDTFDAESVVDMVHASNVADSMRDIDRAGSLRRHGADLRKWLKKLPDRTSTRDEATLQIWLLEPSGNVSARRQLARMNREWRYKTTIQTQGRTQTIFGAIAQSPFKDIGTAQKALKLGIVAAAKLCVSISRNKTLSVLATSMLHNMVSRTSPEVAARVLGGLRGCGSTFECWLNPIMLSWASHLGVELALDKAMWSQIKTTKEWDTLLDSIQHDVLRTAIKEGTLTRISKY